MSTTYPIDLGLVDANAFYNEVNTGWDYTTSKTLSSNSAAYTNCVLTVANATAVWTTVNAIPQYNDYAQWIWKGPTYPYPYYDNSANSTFDLNKLDKLIKMVEEQAPKTDEVPDKYYKDKYIDLLEKRIKELEERVTELKNR